MEKKCNCEQECNCGKFIDYQFESSVMDITDAMGRKVIWNDSGN